MKAISKRLRQQKRVCELYDSGRTFASIAKSMRITARRARYLRDTAFFCGHCERVCFEHQLRFVGISTLVESGVGPRCSVGENGKWMCTYCVSLITRKRNAYNEAVQRYEASLRGEIGADEVAAARVNPLLERGLASSKQYIH